jgi:hypothetical protein
MSELDVELEQLVTGQEAIRCRRCRTPFPLHGAAGGAVTVRVGGWASPADAVPLTCPGFLWVDPGGPPVGSYGEEPQR